MSMDHEIRFAAFDWLKEQVALNVYNRRCAVTQEKTLPAPEAAHIKPFSDSGPSY
jgi:hypothetical protein